MLLIYVFTHLIYEIRQTFLDEGSLEHMDIGVIIMKARS